MKNRTSGKRNENFANLRNKLREKSEEGKLGEKGNEKKLTPLSLKQWGRCGDDEEDDDSIRVCEKILSFVIPI